MVRLIDEHDTWISLDPIVGCPLDCRYCYLRGMSLTRTAATLRHTAKDTIAALRDYLAEDEPLSPRNSRAMRVVCIGNHTDILLTTVGREFLRQYVPLHHQQLPSLPVVLITKASLQPEFLQELDDCGHPIVIICSQSFFSWYQDVNERVEQGVARPEQTAQNFRLLSRLRHIRPVHFWRPLTAINLPSDAEAHRQLELIRSAGAVASVAVGLKRGPFLSVDLRANGSPLRSALDTKGDDVTPPEEEFPSVLRERALRAAHALNFPVYLNTSCAVSLALGIPEYLQTWRAPVRHARCEPIQCPTPQRTRCSGCTLAHPGESDLARIADRMFVPPSAVTWDGEEGVLRIHGRVSQREQCRVGHATGYGVRPSVLHRSREWVGVPFGMKKTASVGIDLLAELPLQPGDEKIATAVDRLHRITGMISPIGPEGDLRPSAFSRYLHVRRVASVALSVAGAAAGNQDSLNLVRVRRLAWLHDLNRWPFAHNSERGRFDQAEDIDGFLQAKEIAVSADDLRDLIGVHGRASTGLSPEGELLLAADYATGMIEDVFFGLTAFGMDQAEFPQAQWLAMGLPLRSSAFEGSVSMLAGLFASRRDIGQYVELFDQTVSGYAVAFIRGHLRHPSAFELSPDFRDIVLDVKRNVLVPLLYPIGNESVGHGATIRTRIVEPLIRDFGEGYCRRFQELDDRSAIELACAKGYVDPTELVDILPNLDWRIQQ
jgi:hypothetical protein